MMYILVISDYHNLINTYVLTLYPNLFMIYEIYFL